MRVLAVDYGERRTGIAVSDELGMTAQGMETLVVSSEDDLLVKLAAVAQTTQAETIVLGLPLNMDGTESEKSLKVRAFGERLAGHTGRKVVFWDERMTTAQAQRVMREMSVKTRGRKGQIDRIAATLILQEFLKTIP